MVQVSDDASTTQALLRTPLYEEHLALGARMLPFGGWNMPIEYSGILDEHRTTRGAVGLFDLSHMGEFSFSGPSALDLVSALITNNPAALAPGQGLYAPMCREDGTIIDDVIVYRWPASTLPEYLMVVNAASIARDWLWVTETAASLGLTQSIRIENQSQHTALIAVQGPHAIDLLSSLAATEDRSTLAQLPSFAVASIQLGGRALHAARTGYTGEDGFELLIKAEDAVSLWRLLITAGTAYGAKPIGLGARDTLRLEARLPLYGNDISDSTTPLEAGLARWVKFDKPSFIGRAALLQQQQRGLHRKLVGIAMLDRSIPRSHYPVLSPAGEQIGELTSGSFAPTLGKGIGLAYLPLDMSTVGTPVQISIRGQNHQAAVVKTPFYKRAK